MFSRSQINCPLIFEEMENNVDDDIGPPTD